MDAGTTLLFSMTRENGRAGQHPTLPSRSAGSEIKSSKGSKSLKGKPERCYNLVSIFGRFHKLGTYLRYFRHSLVWLRKKL
jgi:hypothetical protein